MLLTDELRERFRKLGEQDTQNPIIPVVFHAPWLDYYWYPFSYDEAKECFYGIIQTIEIKIDYFSHIDLMIARSAEGQRVVRDPSWVETDLNRLRLRLNYNI